MRRFLLIFLGIMSTASAFFLFNQASTGSLYIEYQKLWDYRRLHPEFIPDARTATYFSAGNMTTYADSLWINLIQYIWDNIGNGKFVTFFNPILKTIADLHPHFMRPYTLSLLLAPNPNTEKQTYEKDKEIAEKSYELWSQWVKENCSAEKMEQIRKSEAWKDLWSNESLKNPCTDGMLPYYMAYVAGSLWNLSASESYYKIASMNDDAPKASRFLSILMRAKKWDYKNAALRFFLIAVDGYDESPYACQEKALKFAKKIEKISEIDDATIAWFEKESLDLTWAKDTTNPLASSTTNCYDTTNRWIKQIYIWYITEKTKNHPEIKDGKTLLESGIISHLPSIKEQKWWTIRRQKDDSWEYRKD